MKRLSKVCTVFQLVVFAIILCGSFEGCKKKVDYNKLLNEIQAQRKSLQKKVNNEYCYKITKSILESHFSQIDTVIMSKESKASVYGGDLNYKTAEIGKFYVQIDSKGKVKGTINGKKDEFSYDIFYERIDIDELDIPSLNDYSMSIKDKEGYYLSCIYDGKKEDVTEMNEKIKSNAKNNVVVDGIVCRYINREGNAIIFSSNKTLTPSQMAKVGKMTKLEYSMIEFIANGQYYADYVYATGCVIYKSDGRIVKTDNRKLY